MELKETVEEHWSLWQTVVSVHVSKLFVVVATKKGVLGESLKRNSRMASNKGWGTTSQISWWQLENLTSWQWRMQLWEKAGIDFSVLEEKDSNTYIVCVDWHDAGSCRHTDFYMEISSYSVSISGKIKDGKAEILRYCCFLPICKNLKSLIPLR